SGPQGLDCSAAQSWFLFSFFAWCCLEYSLPPTSTTSYAMALCIAIRLPIGMPIKQPIQQYAPSHRCKKETRMLREHACLRAILRLPTFVLGLGKRLYRSPSTVPASTSADQRLSPVEVLQSLLSPTYRVQEVCSRLEQ